MTLDTKEKRDAARLMLASTFHGIMLRAQCMKASGSTEYDGGALLARVAVDHADALLAALAKEPKT